MEAELVIKLKIATGYTPTSIGMMLGSRGTKMTGRWRRFRGMGTDRDMKGSKVIETWAGMM